LEDAVDDLMEVGFTVVEIKNIIRDIFRLKYKEYKQDQDRFNLGG
jgi:hypothetical protein